VGEAEARHSIFFAKGHDDFVTDGRLDSSGGYDLVIFSHVLEHLRNPTRVLGARIACWRRAVSSPLRDRTS
jgi:hypothetical protein